MLTFRQFVTEVRRPPSVGWLTTDAKPRGADETTPEVVSPGAFSLKSVKNRRFMFQPSTRVLVLGGNDIGTSSHSTDFADAHAPGNFGGWIGTGGRYKAGIVHFAPGFSVATAHAYAAVRHVVDRGDDDAADDFIKTLEFFVSHGGSKQTAVRGLMLDADTPFETTVAKSFPWVKT